MTTATKTRDQTKVCVECKHYVKRGKFDRCKGQISLVTGERFEGTAHDIRGKKGACGPTGKLYEQKSTKGKDRF